MKKNNMKRKVVAVLCVAVLSVPAIAVEVIPNGESMVKEIASAISEGREANLDSIDLDEVETVTATVEVSSTLAAETTATATTATIATTATTTEATSTTETASTTKSTTTTTTTTTTAPTTTTAKAAKTTAVTTKRATTQTTTKKTTPKKEEAPTQQIEVAEDYGQVADADAHEPIIAGAGAPQDMGGGATQNVEPEDSWSDDDDVVIADEPANDWSGPVLNPHDGIVPASQTPSGYKETYYNLRMDGCLRLLGLDPSLAGVRDDGVKTWNGYVMVASPDLSAHDKKTYVETTLGTGIVVDYCPSGNLDIATTW